MRRQLLPAVVLVGLVAWGLDAALPTGELRDYGSFVASGRAAARGQNPYGIHPLTYHVVLPAFEVWNPNLNPPVSVPVFTLFDRVDPQQGFRRWWIVSLLSYAAAVLLLTRRYGAGRSWLLPLWAMALAGVWDTLALGQIYLPLVLAATGSWLLLERGRALAAGLLLGVVVAVKPNFAVWPLLLLVAGHWRPALAAAAAAAAISTVPLLIHGTAIYRQWIELVLSDSGRAAFLTNASLPGLAQRVGSSGSTALLLSAAVLVALAAWAMRRRPSPLWASAFGIVGGIVASPIAWVHYTLFLLPVFFWLHMSGPLLVSAALLVVPVPLMLRLLDAPLWQQLTGGSVYNWGVLCCVTGLAMARTRTAVRGGASGLTIVFYDGLCGLCDRFVRFVLPRDRRALLRFAPLQGDLARRELVPAGFDPADLDSVLVLAGAGMPGQRVLARSRAVLHVLRQLGGGWVVVAALGALVPPRAADRLYDAVARRRYRWFGRYDTCPLPRPEWRSRFVDDVVTDG